MEEGFFAEDLSKVGIKSETAVSSLPNKTPEFLRDERTILANMQPKLHMSRE